MQQHNKKHEVTLTQLSCLSFSIGPASRLILATPHFQTADYSIREEMVLKVAILAEKYATDYKWYVDVILNLIRLAGDYVSEEVWYRVIQIVINRDDVQGYAAKTVFEVSVLIRNVCEL